MGLPCLLHISLYSHRLDSRKCHSSLTAILTATQHTLASEQGVHRRRGLLLHIEDHMGVDIQCQPNTTMPKEFADHFGMDALLQRIFTWTTFSYPIVDKRVKYYFAGRS